MDEPTPRKTPRPPTAWLAALLVLVLAVLVGAYVLTRDDDEDAATTAPTATAATTAETATTAPTAPPAPGVVPDVVGQPVEQAAQAFAEEGLRLDLFHKVSNEPAGNVLAQDIAAGTELPAGELVLVEVSAGSDVNAWVSVPDVGGLPLDEARTTLEQADFEPLPINLDGEARGTDTVDLQAPEASAAIPPGSLVLLYVAR